MTDKQLIKFAKEFRKGMLPKNNSGRMCYAVCAPLSTLLQMSGVANTLEECEVHKINSKDVWAHWFIRLPDGRILDPTADQFNRWLYGSQMPDVYLGEQPHYYKPLIEPTDPHPDYIMD